MGTLISLSSNHWVLIWVGLELNLISFIPLLYLSDLNNEHEAAMKYFLSQALGSSLLLIGGSNLYFSPQSSISSSISLLIILAGLLTKLGLPPCHFWFPSVITFLSWPICLILSTWQKVAPLFLLTYLYSSFSFSIIFLIIMARSLVGGFGGFAQCLLKPLLSYSSIGHISWIIAANLSSFSYALLYFLIYVIVSSSIILVFFIFDSNYISSLTPTSKLASLIFLTLLLSLLSLGGVPPFLGFAPKWIVIQALSSTNFLVPLILILGSLINLFYYLNLLFVTLINSCSPLYTKNIETPYFPLWPILICSLTILVTPSLIIIL